MTVQRFECPLAAILIGVAFAAPLSAEPPVAPVAARAAVVEEAEEPVEQIRPDADRLFADFGAAAFGWLRVELPAAAETDMTVTVHLGEKRAGDSVDRTPGGSVRYQAVEAIIPVGNAAAEIVPRWQPKYAAWIEHPPGLREVMPFRYVEIEGLPPQPTAVNFEAGGGGTRCR